MDTNKYYDQLCEAAKFVRETIGTAEVALVLGSGLNELIDVLEDKKEVSFADVPHLPRTTVAGHKGRLATGMLGGQRVMCFAGRTHAYEGYHNYQLDFAPRLMKLCGCHLLIATNASGGAQHGMYEGCIMAVTDHICFTKRNPLDDSFEDPRLGVRHHDTSSLYSKRILDVARSVAKSQDLRLFEGVYGWTPGPSFETGAEVPAGVKLGASVYGMSTVPEVMAASAAQMEVFCLALVTNLAAGISSGPLSHEEVKDAALEAGPTFRKLLLGILANLKVQSMPALPTTPSSDVRPRSLPVPSVGPPNQDQVKAGATTLAQGLKLKQDAAVTAYIVAPAGSAWTLGAHGAVSMPVTGIYGFHAVSPSAQTAKLAAVPRADGSLALVLHACHPEDLSTFEHAFLVAVAKEAGAKHVVTAIPAVSVGSDAGVHTLGDVTAACTRAIPMFHDPRLGADVSRRLDLGQHAASYMMFPGPTLPTPAERHVAQLAGSSCVGMASTAPMRAAAQLGLVVRAVVVAAPAATASVAAMLDAVKSAEKDGEKAVWALAEAAAAAPAPVAARAAVDSAYAAVSRPVQPPEALLPQNDRDHVEEAAAYIVKRCNLTETTVTHAVVYANSVRRHVGHLGGVRYSQIPHMPRGSCASEPGDDELHGELLAALNPDRKSVTLILAGSVGIGEPTMRESDNAFLIRVLYALNVRKIVFVAAGVPAKDLAGAKAGALALMSNHGNMQGLNPLFGLNDDRWGDRFFDVTQPYDAELSAALTSAAASCNTPLVQGAVVGWVNNPALDSRQDACLAAACDYNFLSTEPQGMVLTALHMKIKVAGLLIVVRDAVTSAASLSDDEFAAAYQRAGAVVTAALPALSK